MLFYDNLNVYKVIPIWEGALKKNAQRARSHL